MKEEPTEWKPWGIYFVSKEGYVRVSTYIPNGKPIGTYIIPRIIQTRTPRYRLTKKGIQQAYKISDVVNKVWGTSCVITVDQAIDMRECAYRWNEESRKIRESQEKIRRPRLAKTRTKIDPFEDYGNEDPFMCSSHPQYDPFSNWR